VTDQRQEINFSKQQSKDDHDEAVKKARNSLSTMVKPDKMNDANQAFTIALDDPLNKDLTPKQIAVKVSGLPEYSKKVNKLRDALGALPPIPQAVYDDIAKKAKDKVEARKMAKDRGYDPSRIAK
jgi:predicted component of type VI protein secretion system